MHFYIHFLKFNVIYELRDKRVVQASQQLQKKKGSIFSIFKNPWSPRNGMVVKRLDLESASIVTTLKTTILLIDVCVYKRAIKAQADEEEKRNLTLKFLFTI